MIELVEIRSSEVETGSRQARFDFDFAQSPTIDYGVAQSPAID